VGAGQPAGGAARPRQRRPRRRLPEVGHIAKETVTEERDVGSALLLTDSPDEQVRLFLQSPVVSDKVKAGLRKAQGPRWEWARARREAGERQLQAITEDQTRLRADLREVPQSSPLHKRQLHASTSFPS